MKKRAVLGLAAAASVVVALVAIPSAAFADDYRMGAMDTACAPDQVATIASHIIANSTTVYDWYNAGSSQGHSISYPSGLSHSHATGFRQIAPWDAATPSLFSSAGTTCTG